MIKESSHKLEQQRHYYNLDSHRAPLKVVRHTEYEGIMPSNSSRPFLPIKKGSSRDEIESSMMAKT